jgi:hypothetical protein
MLGGEPTLRPYLEAGRKEMLAADAAAFTNFMASLLPEIDKRAVLDNEEVGQMTMDGFHEALRTGVDGWLDDDIAEITGKLHVMSCK